MYNWDFSLLNVIWVRDIEKIDVERQRKRQFKVHVTCGCAWHQTDIFGNDILNYFWKAKEPEEDTDAKETREYNYQYFVVKFCL